MLRQILYALAVLILVILPFLGTIVLSKFSPYFKDNAWGTYTSGWVVYLIVSAIAGWLLASKTLSRQLFYGGFILYLIGATLVAVGGLAAAPDFGPELLKHPEREQFRYAFLLMAAVLFATGVLLFLRNKWQLFPKWNRWIVLLLVPAFAELFWEFMHQYLTYDRMKTWVEKGKNAADFGNHYFDLTVLKIGATGRAFQYILIGWLAFMLMRGKHLRKWAFAIIIFFCAMGLTSAIVIIVTGMHMPKNLEFLFLFFIPAGPLLLLYWEGVALLTTKSASQANKN